MPAWNDQKMGSWTAVSGSCMWRLMLVCKVLWGPDSIEPGLLPNRFEGSGLPANRGDSGSCTIATTSPERNGGGVFSKPLSNSCEPASSNADGKCTPCFGFL